MRGPRSKPGGVRPRLFMDEPAGVDRLSIAQGAMFAPSEEVNLDLDLPLVYLQLSFVYYQF
jgi:hypothetical protein